MAYITQELKAELAPAIKAVLKKYNMKGTLSIRNHMVLSCNISTGSLDVIGNMLEVAAKSPMGDQRTDKTHKPTVLSVNPHWIAEFYSGDVRDFLIELKDAMSVGNHDNSDIQTDYFDVGWYIDINIGKWNKGYQLLSA